MARKLLLLLVLATPAVAVAKPAELPLRSGESFQVQQQKVQADLRGGEVYSEISAENRGRVLEALERMSSLVGEGSIESLSPEKKVEAFNDQELVNNLLTQAREDSRLICRRERTLGSQMATSQCFTVAERERMKQNSQSYMRSMQSGKDVKVGN